MVLLNVSRTHWRSREKKVIQLVFTTAPNYGHTGGRKVGGHLGQIQPPPSGEGAAGGQAKRLRSRSAEERTIEERPEVIEGRRAMTGCNSETTCIES